MGAVEPCRPSFEEYLHRLSGQEKEPDVISSDHNYCKSWSSHADSHHSKPAKLLFMKLRRQTPEIIPSDDVPIDVESMEQSPVIPPYDNQKTRAMMNECDQFLQNSLDHEPEEFEQLNKNGWNLHQKSLHKQMMKILQSSHLSKLALSGTAAELVRRKITIEKAARRARKLFASYTWEMTLLCWLHQTLMDSLSAPMLSEYFEILRSLKAKVPNLIDKLLVRVTSFHSGIFGNCSTEAFSQLLRKPWDPVLSCMTQNKPKKVAGNPLIIVVPSAPNQTIANQNQRMKFIWNQMGSLGKVIHSTIHSSGNTAVDECLDQIFTATRSKVVELKNQHPTRPIILAGWTIGALLACHIALEETVAAVVCFGFPLKGVGGSRGDLDDPLLDGKVPTLFLIGQNSCACSMDDIEDFRERMRAETGLVVVGGADEMLRLSVMKKKTEGVTQSMVDRCLVDEVADFLNSVISQPCTNQTAANKRSQSVAAAPTIHLQQQNHQQYSNQKQQQTTQSHVTDEAKRQRRKPREYSPEFSPAKRKPKPTNTYQPAGKISASTSSDTSSTGSCAQERASKREKKKPSRKSGRSSFSIGKRRRVSKIVRGGLKMKLSVNAQTKKDLAAKQVENLKPPSPRKPLTPQKGLQPDQQPLSVKVAEEKPQTSSSTSPKLPSSSTMPSPQEVPVPKKPQPLDVPRSLSLANQNKSNGPVDVEKAFGRDSSFLPRPLTPAEMDQNDAPVMDSNPVAAQAASISGTASAPVDAMAVGSVAVNVQSPEKKKVTFLTATNAESFPLVTFSTSVGSTAVAIPSPQIPTEPLILQDSSAKVQQTAELIPATTELLALSKSTIQQQPPTAILSSGGLTIKQLHGTITSLSGKSILSSPVVGTIPKQQTILVSPSTSISKPTTYLMTTPDVGGSGPKKIQVRRMVMKPAGAAATSSSPSKLSVPFVTKLNPGSSIVSTSETLQVLEPKTCNLSLLSDVAGMKEPIRQMTVAQEFLPASPSATLVKLSSDITLEKRTVPNPVRRFRLIEAHPPTTQQTPPCLDTPEEFAEKQMAIQALSSSLNEGNDDNSGTSEGALTVGFSHKPVPRVTVPRPYSVMGYPVVMPRPAARVFGSRLPFRGGGRARGSNPFGPMRKPRVQRFYPF